MDFYSDKNKQSQQYQENTRFQNQFSNYEYNENTMSNSILINDLNLSRVSIKERQIDIEYKNGQRISHNQMCQEQLGSQNSYLDQMYQSQASGLNRPRNYEQRLKRIPQGKLNKQRSWWNDTFNASYDFFNRSSKIHFSIVIGNSQQGKDTFIANLDMSLLDSKQLVLGDGYSSLTKKFVFLKYKNCNILSNAKGAILNTIGLGDTSLQKRDDEIIFEIFSMIMSEASKVAGGINTFYFVQSLTTEPVGAIERSMILMEAALGKEIFKSSVIIATKGNVVYDERDLEHGMEFLKKLAKKYNIQGGVIDFRSKHLYKGKGDLLYPLSSQEEKQQTDELSACVQSLAFFSLKPLLNQLKLATERLQVNLKEQCKVTKEIQVKKTKYVRQWYTLWLFKTEKTYYDIEYETYFTQTDEALFQQASEQVLKQNLEKVKEKLSKTAGYR